MTDIASGDIIAATETIDLTPTADGFASIALTLIASLRSDVRADRRDAFDSQMFGIIDIARYLAAKCDTDPEARTALARLLAGTR